MEEITGSQFGSHFILLATSVSLANELSSPATPKESVVCLL